MVETREVFPGDEVAVEEEYLASDGTFAKDGKIYASQIGTLELNDAKAERISTAISAMGNTVASVKPSRVSVTCRHLS